MKRSLLCVASLFLGCRFSNVVTWLRLAVASSVVMCGLGAVLMPASVTAEPFCASPIVSAPPAIVYLFDDSGEPVAQPEDIVSEGGVFSASGVLLGTVDADYNIEASGGEVIGYVDGASSGG